MKADQILFNGKLLPAGTPLASAGNRGLRYGDGLFETMKLLEGKLLFSHLHFDRLFSGMRLLGFEPPAFFTPSFLEKHVLDLAEKNGRLEAARIRLMVFRADGGLYDPVSHAPQWVVETMPLAAGHAELNTNGLVLGIFEKARKSTDAFSSLKSNNFLPYLAAALHAKEQCWNDALLLNAGGRIADSTIANVFWEEKGILYTPPLEEGPVAGTVRRRLLEGVPGLNLVIKETACSPERLMAADAVFLTNAIQGLRWVGRIGDRAYAPGPAQTVFSCIAHSY